MIRMPHTDPTSRIRATLLPFGLAVPRPSRKPPRK